MRFILRVFNKLTRMRFLNILPDKVFLKTKYRLVFRKKLDLKQPKTFNAKLQWLKIYDRKKIYSTMVDKYEVKKYISSKIGEQYVVSTLGVWDSFDEIDFNKLPDKFVLKCTHDSGGLIICRDKAELNLEEAKKKINKSLKRNYFWNGREWPYKNVKPRIIAEEFIEDKNYKCLPVYKIFCFNGEPKIIQTIQNDKQKNESIDYFDTDWNLLDLRQNYPNSEKPFERPEKLDEMLKLAKQLSLGFSFLRVDFYSISSEIIFSEFTFYSDCGFAKFYPDSWDLEMGKWIELKK